MLSNLVQRWLQPRIAMTAVLTDHKSRQNSGSERFLSRVRLGNKTREIKTKLAKSPLPGLIYALASGTSRQPGK